MQSLHISRITPGLYEWKLAWERELVAQGDLAEKNIADCMTEASGFLIDEEPHIEIWYRGVCMGTVRTAKLTHDPASLADRIVDLYAELY